MSTTKTTYELNAGQLRHVGEVRQQLEALELYCLKCEGLIRRNEREMSFMRRHLALYFGELAAAAGLPMGATLSPDGRHLVAPAAPAAAGGGDGLAS